MLQQSLYSYLLTCKEKGADLNEVVASLRTTGWSESVILEARDFYQRIEQTLPLKPVSNKKIIIGLLILFCMVFFFGIILMLLPKEKKAQNTGRVDKKVDVPGFFGIDESRQFAQANNTQRRSDVTAILNAINQYALDNEGNLPVGMPKPEESIRLHSRVLTDSGTGSDLCNALVPTYIAELPRDPQVGSYTNCDTYNTGYVIAVGGVSPGITPRITISAPSVELGTVISVTR